MLLIWIAATQYQKRYVPVEDDTAQRRRVAVERDDEEWLILHVTGQWW